MRPGCSRLPAPHCSRRQTQPTRKEETSDDRTGTAVGASHSARSRTPPRRWSTSRLTSCSPNRKYRRRQLRDEGCDRHGDQTGGHRDHRRVQYRPHRYRGEAAGHRPGDGRVHRVDCPPHGQPNGIRRAGRLGPRGEKGLHAEEMAGVDDPNDRHRHRRWHGDHRDGGRRSGALRGSTFAVGPVQRHRRPTTTNRVRWSRAISNATPPTHRFPQSKVSFDPPVLDPSESPSSQSLSMRATC